MVLGRLPNSIPSEILCVGCGRLIKTTDFHPNFNKYHQYKRMFWCKECCKTISQEIMSSNASFETACRSMCVTFDIPFIYDAMNILKEEYDKGVKDRNIDFVFNYLKALKQINLPEEYWDDLSTSTFAGLDVLKVAKPTSDGDVELLQGLKKDWGTQDSIEDYLFLEEKFNQYTDGETMSPSMINIVRYLCEAELSVKKLKKDKADIKDIKIAEERVSIYYKQLKLDDFKFNSAKSDVEKLIETFAWYQEEKEPLDWEDENLKDRLGIDKDYNDIMRSLGNKVLNMKEYPKLTQEDIERNYKKRKIK